MGIEPQPPVALDAKTQQRAVAVLAALPPCDCDHDCDCWEHLQLMTFAAKGYRLTDKQVVVVNELIELFGGGR